MYMYVYIYIRYMIYDILHMLYPGPTFFSRLVSSQQRIPASVSLWLRGATLLREDVTSAPQTTMGSQCQCTGHMQGIWMIYIYI